MHAREMKDEIEPWCVSCQSSDIKTGQKIEQTPLSSMQPAPMNEEKRLYKFLRNKLVDTAKLERKASAKISMRS